LIFLDFHFFPRDGGSWPEARQSARRNSPSQRFWKKIIDLIWRHIL
jgi:hypothetical protein